MRQRRSSPPRTSTDTTRCWCRPAGSGRSPGRSWPNWCRTPGSPRPPPAGEPPGWRHTAPRRTPTRTRPTATCGPSPDRAPTGVALVGTGPKVAASSGSWLFLKPPSARTLPDAVLAVRVDAEIAQTNADLEVVVLTADLLDEASAPTAATS